MEPVDVGSSGSGEAFAPGVLKGLTARLADLPLLDTISSTSDLGPDSHVDASTTAPLGMVIVVSPIETTGSTTTIRVQVGPPGGGG